MDKVETFMINTFVLCLNRESPMFKQRKSRCVASEMRCIIYVFQVPYHHCNLAVIRRKELKIINSRYCCDPFHESSFSDYKLTLVCYNILAFTFLALIKAEATNPLLLVFKNDKVS